MGCVFMLLLIAECIFTKKKIFAAKAFIWILQNRLPLKHYNNSICKASQNSFSETSDESLNILSLCRLVPVHGCNLVLLPNNYASNYLLSEIVLFLRPMHNILRSRFVGVFCLSFFLKRKHFVTLHKIFFHQI